MPPIPTGPAKDPANSITKLRGFRLVNTVLLLLSVAILISGNIVDYISRGNVIHAAENIISDIKNIPIPSRAPQNSATLQGEISENERIILSSQQDKFSFFLYIIGVLITPLVLICWLFEMVSTAENQLENFRSASDNQIKMLGEKLRGLVEADYIEQFSEADDEIKQKLKSARFVFNTMIDIDYYELEDWNARNDAIEKFLSDGGTWTEVAHAKYFSNHPKYSESILGWQIKYPHLFKLMFVNDASAYIDFIIIGYGSGIKDEVFFGWNRSSSKSLQGVFHSQNFEIVTLFKSHFYELQKCSRELKSRSMTVGSQACGLWCDAIFAKSPDTVPQSNKSNIFWKIPRIRSAPKALPSLEYEDHNIVGYGLLMFYMEGRTLNVEGMSFWIDKNGALALNHRFSSLLGASSQEDLVISGPHRRNETGVVTGVSLYKFGAWDTEKSRPLEYEGMFASLLSGAYRVHGFRAEGKASNLIFSDGGHIIKHESLNTASLDELRTYDASAVHVFDNIDPNKLKDFVDKKLELIRIN